MPKRLCNHKLSVACHSCHRPASSLWSGNSPGHIDVPNELRSIWTLAVVNVGDVVMKVNNLSDKLREPFNIGWPRHRENGIWVQHRENLDNTRKFPNFPKN